MGLFDRFKKKNQEEAVTPEEKEQGSVETKEKEGSVEPEEKLEAAEENGKNQIEELVKAFEETTKVQEGINLLQALMRNMVSVPVTMSMSLDALDALNAGKDFNLDRAMEVNPDVLTVNGKERALPLFTSRDKIPMDYLQKKQLSVSEMPFRQMCQLFLEQKDKYDCIAINPMSTNMRVPKEVVESMLGLRKPNPQENKIQIGLIPKIPEKLEEAVKQLGGAHEEISRIFLQILIKDKVKSFLLVVDGDMEELRKSLKGLGEEFKQISQGTVVSVATYAGQLRKVLEDNKVQPVYVKEG